VEGGCGREVEGGCVREVEGVCGRRGGRGGTWEVGGQTGPLGHAPANKQTSWGMPQQKVNEPWSATGATAKNASCEFLSAPAPTLSPPDLGSKPIGSAQSKRLQAVATP
jgi:hypothetical protein